MAKRYYTKGASYVHPAGTIPPAVASIDGLYVNSDLFENNIPVMDATLHVRVSPDARHDCNHSFRIFMPIYNGSVSWVDGAAGWNVFESGERSFDIASNGNPYGIGLYSFYIFMEINTGIPIFNDIIYYVAYEMEVDI